MSFHGGFAGMSVATWWFAQRRNLHFYDIADHVSIPAGVFLGLGRVANFINAELIGTPFNGNWCVSYPADRMQALGLNDVCRHPYQVYAALKNAALTPFLYTANIAFALPSGTLFWGFTWLYSAARILVDTYRVEPSLFLGLSMGQLLSLVFAAVSSYMLIRVYQDNG
jgi:phosphatidylglycerol:prolipoprotein diacylglycerol transferase